MSPNAKKKVVAVCAGFLTLVILGAWTLHSYGLFASAFESTRGQGVAVFSFLEQNVERAYNSFQENAPNLNTASVTMATSTEDTEITEDMSTTTPNEIEEGEFRTGQAEQ